MDTKEDMYERKEGDTKVVIGEPAPGYTQGQPQCQAQACKKKSWGYEYKTEANLFGWPLLHIAFGRDSNGKMRVAKGIFAIGQFVVALLAGLGQFTIAPVAISQFALCIAGIGQFIACLFGIGQFGAGLRMIGHRVVDLD